MISSREPKIIYEDSKILVCEKPAGLATQTSRVGQKDLVSMMMNHVSDGHGRPYLGLVNRLDQPVSGLVLFAKDQTAAAALSAEQKMHDMTKEYRAAVLGKLNVKSGYMSDYIIADAGNNTSRVTDEKEDGAKKAVLEFTVLCEDSDRKDEAGTKFTTTIISVHLITGRHHQIRLQMSHAGFPILGDNKYGSDESKRVSELLGVKDLALCACRLSFTHPLTHKIVEYESDPEAGILKI